MNSYNKNIKYINSEYNFQIRVILMFISYKESKKKETRVLEFWSMGRYPKYLISKRNFSDK